MVQTIAAVVFLSLAISNIAQADCANGIEHGDIEYVSISNGDIKEHIENSYVRLTDGRKIRFHTQNGLEVDDFFYLYSCFGFNGAVQDLPPECKIYIYIAEHANKENQWENCECSNERCQDVPLLRD